MTQPWTERIDVNNTQQCAATHFLACVLRAAGDTALPPIDKNAIIPMRPARVSEKNGDILAYAGGPLYRYDAIANILAEWFGTPQVEQVVINEEIHSKTTTYANGITLNYMAHRDGGITLSLPQRTKKEVSLHVARALSEMNERKSQSTIAP